LICTWETRDDLVEQIGHAIAVLGRDLDDRLDPELVELDRGGPRAYSLLSPSIKAKLAALPKGELMVRHPHFTQPIFVRFPRPPVLNGREGIERFPPEPDVPFEEAVIRRLRGLNGSVPVTRLKDLIAGRTERDVVRALHATIRTRPGDVVAFFVKCLGREAPSRTVAPRAGITPIKRVDDPYA
jgi:hypothetical protein